MDERNERSIKGIIALIVILAGVVMLIIGGILWANGGREKYLKSEDFSITNQPVDDVSKIDLEIESGIVTIKRGGDKLDCVVTNAPADLYSRGVKNNTFYIEKKNNLFSFSNWLGYMIFMGDKKPKFEISVPDKLYDKVVVDIGSGSLTIEDIRAKELDIDCGAGEINGKNLVGENVFDVDTGAGEQKLIGCRAGSLKIDCGAGEVIYSGEVTEKADIDGGAGEIDITVFGNYNDYDVDVDRGIGEVNIDKGDTSVSGRGNIPVVIDGGVGAIKLKFVNKVRGEVNS